MIGQENILEKFNNFDNIPLSVLLLGPRGYGKKTLVKTMSENLNINIIKIGKSFSDDLKTDLYTYTNPAILLLDLTQNIQQKQIFSLQNSALKFIEELPTNYRLFILAENESFVLDTILNRCYIQVMEDYSIDELILLASEYNKKILDQYDNQCFEYLKSPYDILIAPSIDELREIEKLVDTIFSSIGRANISNILSISKKIDFDNSIGLYNLNIFLNVFNCKLVNLLITNFDNKYFKIFTLFNELNYNIKKANINKINIFENFLLDMKYIMA